jgi:hypothetical protein
MMDSSWQKVFESPLEWRAELLRAWLSEEYGIHSVVLNKKDSSYNLFGQCELYVPATDAVFAKYLIDHEGKNTDPTETE